MSDICRGTVPSTSGRCCLPTYHAPVKGRCPRVRRRHAAVASACSSPCSHAAGHTIRVLLTREQGKNGKMKKLLNHDPFECFELPLIEHADGPDRQQLPQALCSAQFDWVTITSPEAASVFLKAWEQAGKPKVRVAVVGGGTAEVLQQAGLQPGFVSSKAMGSALGSELPQLPGGTNHVLYPASVKAGRELQDGLTAAGFTVTRLNTYNTTGVSRVAPELLPHALAADIVTLGSPSAVKAWVALVGLAAAKEKVNACIGLTSATACEAAGLPRDRIYYPDSPGIPGWAEAVARAAQEHFGDAQP